MASAHQQHPLPHNDAFDLTHDPYNHDPVSPVMSRSPSAASDRYSVVSGFTTAGPSAPATVNPRPAYVAPFGASQVVSEHHSSKKRSSSDEEDDKPANDNGVQFSENALALVNAFLDHLLYSFLSAARSTNLLALRPAVTEVLKHRLAREAIASAEEELQELLAGGEEEEELNTAQNGKESKRKWDLELVWKRTRLRVMVYMRLGEMEDDDEERYVKEEELFHGTERRFSQSTGLVSWAAAIFLTSVLEYVAEQTLQVAGQAAYSRERRQSRSQRYSHSGVQTPDHITVEEYDVEKVALNSTLGRLWRTWRKSLRTPATHSLPQRNSLSRLGQNGVISPSTTRRGSFGPEGSVVSAVGEEDSHRPSMALAREDIPDMPELHYPEHVLASNIPLPIGRRDVDEIEVPGLARDPDASDEGSKELTAGQVKKRSSLADLGTRTFGGLLTMPGSYPVSQEGGDPQRPGLDRLRSHSVPPKKKRSFLADVPEGTTGGSNTDRDMKNTSELQHEPKSNMDEMAPHKRQSQDVKALLDKVVNHDAPDETQTMQDKDEHHGIVAGAIAGGWAGAVAAVAMVTGSHTSQTEESKLEPPSDGRNIEELDKRKSLLDIKSLTAPSEAASSGRVSPQILTSSRVAVNAPKSPPEIVRTGSGESNKSYTLGHKERQENQEKSPGKPLDMQAAGNTNGNGKESNIGVASTSDDIPGTPPQSAQDPNAEEEQARGGAHRPSRLVLGGSPITRTKDSPTTQSVNEPPTTPKGFLQSRSLSITGKDTELQTTAAKDPTSSPNERTRASPAPIHPNRSSALGPALVNGAAGSPNLSKSPYRQSWTAAVEKNDPRPKSLPVTTKQEIAGAAAGAAVGAMAGAAVVEHPVVQRMASLKRNQHGSQSDLDKAHPITSASITSPEDFDMFVQGDDTVKYTLTPENVRDQPVSSGHGSVPTPTNTRQASSPAPYPPSLKTAQSVETGTIGNGKRPSPPPLDTSGGRTGRSQVPKQATAAMPPDEADSERTGRADKRRSISRPPPRNVSAHRKSGMMAREPQVMTESTRDFADFIRSTGPTKEQDIAIPLLANRSTTSLHSLRPASINGRARSQSPGGERTKSLTKSVMERENIPPVPVVPPVSGKGKGAMQPRGATSSANGNDELIDFIRNGPNRPSGDHRISRSVAPFRSTMDSDQLKDFGDRVNTEKPVDLRVNTNVNGSGPSVRSASSVASPSNRTSVNSRAALLANGSGNASQVVHPAHSGQPQRLNAPKSAMSPAQADGPSRKRYRNKDPYPIDTDGEDDDLLTALPRNKRQEESLVDFLNNTEPLQNNSPQPLVNGGGAHARSMMNKARRDSQSSLKAATDAQQNGGRTRSMQSSTGPRPGYASSVKSNMSSSSKPGHVSNQIAPPSIAKGPIPKMQSRSAGAKDASSARLGAFHQNTNDLADFLRSSGPEGNGGAPAPVVGKGPKEPPPKEPKKSKGGLFSRRKKTYLDMP